MRQFYSIYLLAIFLEVQLEKKNGNFKKKLSGSNEFQMY